MNDPGSGGPIVVAPSSQRPPVHPPMAEAAWIGLVIIAVSSGFFALGDRGPKPVPEGFNVFTAHYVFRLAAAIVGMFVVRRFPRDRVVVLVLWGLSAVLSASSAYLGVLRGDYTSNALISIGICVGAAAIIPWNWREQTVLALIFLVGLITDAAVLHGGLMQAFRNHILLTIVVCMSGSLYTSISLERARRRMDERVREDDEAIQRLTRDLERRVEERTLELQKANAGLAEVNGELERANQELQGFTYSVSHDLRGALRVIGGYSHLLVEEYGDGLEPDARLYAEQIRSGTIRVGQLVDALLALARVSRTRLRSETVDLSYAALEIATGLRQGDPGRKVEFVLQPGLLVEGDPSLLRILLENLMQNAWKFTRRREGARIDVGAVTGEEGRTFFVRDNGAGFDPRFATKLFEPFERLHDQGDFEGTGIGLATVKRIVGRHGGRVWAEGAEGRGATFFFTLPGLEPSAMDAAIASTTGREYVFLP